MPEAESAGDRILFAVYAVEMKCATSAQISAALGALGDDFSRSLGERLVAERVISPEEKRAIDAAVSRANASEAATLAEPLAGRRTARKSQSASSPSDAETRSSMPDPKAPGLGLEEEEAGLPIEQAGRYTIKGVHGKGGQAKVMLAWDANLQREVALKVMRDPGEKSASVPPYASKRSTPGSLRFLREARVTGLLEHPNIVPVHEVGRTRDGALYYAMRLVRGKTLAVALKECSSLAERLKRLGSFWDICNAVAFAHSHGIVHRDLKPENVMVGEYGETVLLDWGVSKVKGEKDIRAHDLRKELELLRRSDETAAGTAVGTPSYMSPEQAQGLVDDIDDRSDVWGLGAILYELLTGRPPFHGKTAIETLQMVVGQALAPVRELCPDAPPELAAVAEKALQKDKGQRYGSAKELAAEVDAYMTGGRVRAYEYSSWELLRRFAARNKPLVAALAVLSLVIVGALVSVSVSLKQRQEALVAETSARQAAEAAREKEQQERQVANFHLAQAYTEQADRLSRAQRYLSASVFAAASLVHNPSHPRSPFFSPAFGEQRPRSRLARVVAASHHYLAGFGAVAELEAVLTGDEALEQVAFSPDGREVAAAQGKQVRRWAVQGGAPLPTLEGHADRVYAVAYSPDGKLAASGGRDKTVIVWDLATGKPLRRLEGHEDLVHSVDFSPDGRALVSGSYDKTARIWAPETGALLFSITGHRERVNRVVFSRDGRMLATASNDKTARVFSALDGRPLSSTPAVHEGMVSGVAFSPDGLSLATACNDGNIRLFETRSGRLLSTLTGHVNGATNVAFSPDGAMVASVSYDKNARLWDVGSGRPVLNIDGHEDFVHGLAFSPDGRLLATASHDRKVKLWKIHPPRGMVTLHGHADTVYSLAFSRDGRYLASGSFDKTVRVWDVATRKLAFVLQGHTDAVDGGLVFSPDATRLASAGRDWTVRLWDLRTGAALKVLQGPKLAVYGLSISPDGLTLASAGMDRVIRLWDMETGDQVRSFPGGDDVVDGTAFSPDGTLLASASYDRTVRLWKLPQGEALRTLSGHEDWVSGVRFSSDGTRLISSGKDGVAILWDAATGKEIRRFLGHSQWVNDARFSPDGKLVATASDDTTVRVWNAETGETLLVLPANREVVGLEFSPDGGTLAVGDASEVKLYPLDFSALEADPQDLLLEAERRAGQVLEGFELRAK